MTAIRLRTVAVVAVSVATVAIPTGASAKARVGVADNRPAVASPAAKAPAADRNNGPFSGIGRHVFRPSTGAWY